MHSRLAQLKQVGVADLKKSEHQYIEELFMIYQSDYYSDSLKHFVCESVSLNRILQKDPSAKLSPYQIKELCELILTEHYSDTETLGDVLNRIRMFNHILVHTEQHVSCVNSVFEKLKNTRGSVSDKVIKAYCEYFYDGLVEAMDDHLFSILQMHLDEWMNDYRNKGMYDSNIDSQIDDYKMAMWEE